MSLRDSASARTFLLINLITLVGYVLPWLVVSYYLMKAREIAA